MCPAKNLVLFSTTGKVIHNQSHCLHTATNPLTAPEQRLDGGNKNSTQKLPQTNKFIPVTKAHSATRHFNAYQTWDTSTYDLVDLTSRKCK